jgi:uncharacterized protein
MKIRLSEIPPEGRKYSLNRKSGELNETLDDLLQGRPYEVEATIKPLGNTYEIVGHLTTQTSDLCSRCGWDLQLKIDSDFRDYLIEEDADEYRKRQLVHGNQSVNFLNEGPSVTTYHGGAFELGEYIHEQIAIQQPLYPDCGKTDCEHLKEATAELQRLNQEFAAAEEKKAGHPGFAALKNVKIKQ